MNKRLYGMAPGGRMALDRAANRRQTFFQRQRQARNRERRDGDERLVLPPRKVGVSDG